MAYSMQEVVSDGSLELLGVSLDYFNRDEIRVLFDDVQNAYEWDWVGFSEKFIEFPTPIPEGVTVRLERGTRLDRMYHRFEAGAPFLNSTVDQNYAQLLHLIQELRETDPVFSLDPENLNVIRVYGFADEGQTDINLPVAVPETAGNPPLFVLRGGVQQPPLAYTLENSRTTVRLIVPMEDQELYDVSVLNYTVGLEGPQGDPGEDGRTVLNGVGAPAPEVGEDGDFYIDTGAAAIYGPKTAGAWGSGTSLIGPKGDQGDQGDQGDPGEDGRTVLNGASAPDSGIGVDGDFYIDTSTADIYGPKTGGAWGAPTSLIGPKGDQGAPGDMTNPMTEQGDIITGGASGAPQRLAKGTDGHALFAGATGPAYRAIEADDISDAPTAGKALLTAANAAAQRTALSVREQLTANRTYYVRTDGSDSNDGLANTAGGAFKTILKALQVAGTLAIAPFKVTIQLAPGVYESTTLDFIFTGQVEVIGDVADPDSHFIDVFTVSGSGVSVRLDGISAKQIFARAGSFIDLNSSVISFYSSSGGSASSRHRIRCLLSLVDAERSEITLKGSDIHSLIAYASNTGVVSLFSATIEILGAPTWGIAGVICGALSYVNMAGVSFIGTASGKRYEVEQNGVLRTNAGSDFIPGSVAGTEATGGIYV